MANGSSSERLLLELEQRVKLLEARLNKSWMFSSRRWKRSLGVLLNGLFFPLLVGIIALIVMGVSSLLGG